jgi:antitoxin (DNA-binding transcriptional repressor) of toxin-antitoxin stability system
MTYTIPIDLIYNNLPDTLKNVFAGNTIIVEQNTKPIFKIEPLSSIRKRPLIAGSAKGKFKMSKDFTAPLEDFKEYM